jgi:uncharacterized protein (TIGR01777 family)
MNILITGGTGFIGEALLPALRADGHKLVVLSRSAQQASPDPVPTGGPAPDGGLRYVATLSAINDKIDAVINLAGASIAGKRWTKAYKQEIVDSRLSLTRALGEYFSEAGYAPRVWLNASAIGYYGAHGDEELSEQSESGKGFSAQLCIDWEAAARKAAGSARLCLMRLGVVLDRNGGAYAQMAQPFRLGVANWVGDGQQWLSWIHRQDVIAAIGFLLDNEELAGPINLTAPQPVTSRSFCAAMRAVHRTLIALPMPAALMRLLVGEMADELLISGQRVLPDRLMEAGFTFSYPAIEQALEAIEER